MTDPTSPTDPTVEAVGPQPSPPSREVPPPAPGFPPEPTTGTTAPKVASGDAGSRLSGRAVIIGFALVLGSALLVAAIAAVLLTTPAPPPECEPGTDCGGPPPAAEVSSTRSVSLPNGPGGASPAPAAVGPAGIRAGTPWRSSQLAYEFEYSDWWEIISSDDHQADLTFRGDGDAELLVTALPASSVSAQALADLWFAELRKWAPDIKADTRSKNEILGPGIGFVDAIGRTYAGSQTSPQGATTPIGVSLLTASDGRITVAVILIVWNPDSANRGTWQQHFVRGRAELALKTFRWGPVP